MDLLIEPHELYNRLGKVDSERRLFYTELFKGHIDDATLSRIRFTTETGVVLGNNRFRHEIAAALERRVDKYPHGGDRKSDDFKNDDGSSTLTP